MLDNWFLMPRQPCQLYQGIAGEGRVGGCSRTTQYQLHPPQLKPWELQQHQHKVDWSRLCSWQNPHWEKHILSTAAELCKGQQRESLHVYYRNLKWCPLLPLFNFLFLLFSTPVSTLSQDCLKNEGHTDTLDFPVSASSSCLCPEKLSSKRCCRAPNSWWLWWFSQLFQWFILLKWMMIPIIWSGWAKNKKTNKQQLYALLCHVDAVQSRVKAEWGKPFSTAALSKQKWNGPAATL